jgi:uncharacterized protein YjbI with pentapeptide repeats
MINLDTYLELSDADLSRADLKSAHLYGAYLRTANLRGAHLNGADLSGANLSEANISMADLSGANISEADLSGAVLSHTRISGADFRNVQLWTSIFCDVDFREAKNLDTVKHHAPSSIGIDSIYSSHGQIPEVFLRGAGVPDSFITFMKSLTGTALDFYSAFISYSTKNQQLADRIYADLQANNVRCWLATEDLKIGDRFRQRIDESIRLHDKLLLILSEHSVKSRWVEDEVESALERERRDKRLVLFPIRIDDAVMHTDAAWAASIRRTRHIGDFTLWKDHDAYQKAFDRLLKNLRTDAKSGGRDTRLEDGTDQAHASFFLLLVEIYAVIGWLWHVAVALHRF